MGSSAGGAATYADTAKRLAGRSLLAVGSGLAKGVSAVAKGVSALTSDSSDKETVRSLKFALLEWSTSCTGDAASTGVQHPPSRRLPVLMVGLESGFQVWRLDGDNPAELLSRRDGPVTLLEAVPEPRASEGEPQQDELRGNRPLLAVVPAPEHNMAVLGQPLLQQQPSQQQAQKQQHSLQLYSLRSHGYVRSLSFGGEVLGVAASGRLLVVALRGQLQAFDACTLQHTFSCLTYTPPSPPLLLGSSSGTPRHRPQQQQFVTAGLTSRGDGSAMLAQQQQSVPGTSAAAAPPAAAVATLAPFALGPRWLAYAADTPVPQASGQAVAQRLPLGRQDSHASSAGGGGGGSGLLSDAGDGSAGPPLLGSSPSGRSNGLTTAAVADAALAAAAKGGQQLRAGLTAVGSASFKYLSQQYSSWRQGGQQAQQRDLDALEADAAVAGTVVVRDAATRLVVAHFRAHTSPLAALQFSPGGTLLATASVAGHSVNLFRIMPPAAATATAGDAASNTGHAVWLYRLYRGVTPAAICGLSFAPDAAWVAVSSGRGTTHLFHTPAAAPGMRQQGEQGAAALAGGTAAGAAGEVGVVGQPPKLPAVGRARKPGLLSGGAAGAATYAARNLYTGQSADAAPIAAAFLSAGPSSPRSAAAGPGSSEGGDSSLYVVTQDGLLTRHLLHVAAAAGLGGIATSGGAAGLAPGSPGGTSQLPPPQQQQQLELGQDPSGAAVGAHSVLEEADRWDVARHASWPEREELLPGLLPGPSGVSGLGPSEACGSSADGTTGTGTAANVAAHAAQQQLWVAQAEAGALAASGSSSSGGPAALPLWNDPQFRFFELQVQQLQRQRSSSAGAVAGGGGASGVAEAPPLPPLLAVGADEGEQQTGEEPAWLEHLPACPVQQQ